MTPLQSPAQLTDLGILPIRNKPARFAVGSPDGLTSNAWKVWSQAAGDLYIVCRDTFREVKVSLHISGRWRFGFTNEAISENPLLVREGSNRAWEVWNKPDEIAPGITPAFHIPFLTQELALGSDMRIGKSWKKVVFIEESPIPNKTTVLSLFVTSLAVPLRHPTQPSFCLGWWDLPDGRNAQLIAHADPIDMWKSVIDTSVVRATAMAADNGLDVRGGHYFCFFGSVNTGARYIAAAQART